MRGGEGEQSVVANGQLEFQGPARLKKDFNTHTANSRPPPAAASMQFTCTATAGCSFSSSYRSALARHVVAHDGAKPFACSTPGCTFTAAQKANVFSHERTHTGEKPYACEEAGCDCAFSAALR